ncbi:FAD binding domain-containing protein [Streptomyces pactum]|uniref:FAD binding domain-containing protein n=1 Tax=Streptomyces pactum TaxID=68249 RepID=A0ABS0NE46_9ACTN|nr:FAD binding domain-containing protein [Streptomyces pactum]MBH5333445.1 FAD binding domain-containing protein [Streptomyces pactum]
MDLNTVREVVDARTQAPWRTGDAWLAGGTHLYAEPRPQLRRLRDLGTLDWAPLTVTPRGLEIAATCTIAQLLAFATADGPWPHARALAARCCHAFSSSFKVWNTATVGGNLCLALPAGPMISLAAALDGVCLLHGTDGTQRRLPVTAFVTGPGVTALRPGELLRSVTLPAGPLTARTAYRRAALRPYGRSAALVTGTHHPRSGGLTVNLSAATPRPVRLVFTRPPGERPLRTAVRGALDRTGVVDDVHGAPDWRRHLTTALAEEIRRELLTDGRDGR